MFLCRDLNNPLNAAEWDRFEAANYGKLPKNVAAWEKWDRFPDRTGCARYFSRENSGDYEEFLSFAKDWQATLEEYEQFDWPEPLQWKLPNNVRWPMSCLEGHHCWLELMCRQATMNYYHKARWVTDDPTVVGLKEADLEMIAIDKLVSAASEAVMAWLPSERITIEPKKPAAVIQSVTVALGHGSYQLHDGAIYPLSIPLEFKKLFGAFVVKVFSGSLAEPVAWHTLHESVRDLEERRRRKRRQRKQSEQEEGSEENELDGKDKQDEVDPTKASTTLLKALSELRELLNNWGRPRASHLPSPMTCSSGTMTNRPP